MDSGLAGSDESVRELDASAMAEPIREGTSVGDKLQQISIDVLTCCENGIQSRPQDVVIGYSFYYYL